MCKNGTGPGNKVKVPGNNCVKPRQKIAGKPGSYKQAEKPAENKTGSEKKL